MGIMHNKALWVTLMSGGATLTDAQALLRNEPEGLALDFTSDDRFAETGFYGDASIKDLTTSANNYNSSPTTAASSLLTYTSPSVKMCMGPSGTLRYGAQNLITYSQDFSQAIWSADSTTKASGLSDPNGGTTAGSFSQTGIALNYPRNTSFNFTAGRSYRVGAWLRLSAGAFTTVKFAYFNGSAWVPGSALSITSTWTYFEQDFTAAGTPSAGVGLELVNATGTSTVQVAFWHVRQTPCDHTYLATTTAARYALPLEWNSSGSLLGLLVEEARTNSFTYSNTFSNAAWTKTAVSVAQNATGPDGLTSAWTMTDSVATTNFRVSQAPTMTAASWTHSIYAKAGTTSWLRILVDSTSTGNLAAFFNVSAGTVGTVGAGLTATITSVGNGWYRCSVVATMTVAACRIYYQMATADNQVSYTGDGTGTLLLWGAQTELGAFITSPIETFASTVTRAVDEIRLATTAFPLSATTSTIFGEFITPAVISANTSSIVQLVGVDSSNRYMLRNDTLATPRFIMSTTADFNSVVFDLGTLTAGNVQKMAAGIAANDVAAVLDGGTVSTDALNTIPTVTTLHIGSRNLNAELCNGIIRKIMYLPRRMSNAELQTLTSA
jgi:hypothetical protein